MITVFKIDLTYTVYEDTIGLAWLGLAWLGLAQAKSLSFTKIEYSIKRKHQELMEIVSSWCFLLLEITGRNSCEIAWKGAGLTLPEASALTYTKSDGSALTSAPTTAGSYIAKLTVGGATAQVSYTISKAEPTATAPTAISHLSYDGTQKALVTVGSSSHGAMQYALTQTGPFSADIPTGTDVGTYSVYYKVVGDTEHSRKEGICKLRKNHRSKRNCYT